LASRKMVVALLVIALFLSATATYITITKFNEQPVTGSNEAGVGLYVEPVKKSQVGVTVLPLPEEEVTE